MEREWKVAQKIEPASLALCIEDKIKATKGRNGINPFKDQSVLMHLQEV